MSPLPGSRAGRDALGTAVPPMPGELALGRALNTARGARSTGELVWNEVLGRAARSHAADLRRSGELSHTGSDGSDVALRASRAGRADWVQLGEVLALGHPGARISGPGLGAEPAHRAVILNSGFTCWGGATPSGLWRAGAWVAVSARVRTVLARS